MSAGKINATYLNQHFTDTGTQEQTRLAVLIDTLAAATMAEVSSACRDWSQSYKGRPERPVIQTRASEVKAIKAAMDTGAFSPNHLKGYHSNVSEARRVLSELSLSVSGRPQTDSKVRAENRENLAVAVKMVKLAKNGQANSPTLMQDATVEAEKDSARRLAGAIAKKHGIDFALLVADAVMELSDAISKAQVVNVPEQAQSETDEVAQAA